VTGLPKVVTLAPGEVRVAIEEVVVAIVDSVVRCLSKAPPELSQDFLMRGINLVGGGGMLRGLDIRLSRETRVPVNLVDAPLESVVLGAGHCIENWDQLKSMFMGARH
jgi:rod shape-determining protein MreB and related proteins